MANISDAKTIIDSLQNTLSFKTKKDKFKMDLTASFRQVGDTK
jgi:hypothetical protein